MNNASVSHLRTNRRTGLVMALAALAMLGVAFASVPLYRLFCQVTGWGGTTMRTVSTDAAPPAPIPGKTISIRFDSNIGGGIPWLFKPEKNAVTVPIGGKQLAFYKAVNQSAKPVTGAAIFNVSPDEAGKYFVKVECFCFTEQTLQPGEAVDMPVTYYVDPAILKDPVASRISEITLSYTFYPVTRSADSGRETKTRG